MNVSGEDRGRVLLDGFPEEWAALEQHATTCAACAEELRAWKQLSAAANELRDYQESPALWALIETSLRQQQAAPPPRKSFWSSLDFWRHISPAWQSAMVGALAAALAVSRGHLYTRQASSPGDPGNKLLQTSALAEAESTA